MAWLTKYPKPEWLQVRWLKKHFLDDIIKGTEFSAECKARLSKHLCLDRKGGKPTQAEFLITVRRRQATLDYSDPRVRRYNKSHKIIMGNMELVFTDSSRTSIDEVIWREANKKETRMAARTSWDPLDMAPIVLKDLDKLDKKCETLRRKEQHILRDTVLGERTTERCSICGNVYPVELLVAAHIKKRSECSDSEKRDVANVIPMCKFGCDDLFERGFVSVHLGRIKVSRALPVTDSVLSYAKQIKDQHCPYWNSHSARYFKWHHLRAK